MSAYAEAARRIVDALGEQGARELLGLLGSESPVRADAFRQFYERSGHDALLDSLHYLEADPVMRGWLVEHLRLALEP